ncbi:unnamed protein product [Lymnaea stagnalis]|uniref:LIM zinc-binding domain-containing protein n=1 Tax=Lymnaea stagnalis TaxID=6523 RepID=A0AAV2HY31_LYMST
MNSHPPGSSTQFVYSTIGSHPGISSVRVDNPGQQYPPQMTQGYSSQPDYSLANAGYAQSPLSLYPNSVTSSSHAALNYPQTALQNFSQVQSPTYIGGQALIGAPATENVFFSPDLHSPVNVVWNQPIQSNIQTSGYVPMSDTRLPLQAQLSSTGTQVPLQSTQPPVSGPQQPQGHVYYQQTQSPTQFQQPASGFTNNTTPLNVATPSDQSTEVSTSNTRERSGPFYVTSVRPAPPHSYRPDPIHPRRNTLPGSLPTQLNASLQLNQFSAPLTSSAQPVTYTVPPETSIRGGIRSASLDGTKSEDDQTTSGVGSSISSSTSPPGSSPTSPVTSDRTDSQWNTLACYERPVKKDLCLRCNKKVYPMEQIGPIKEVLYHKNCFTCVSCSTKLHLKNFHHNPNDMDDLNVFCVTHRPKDRPLSCDASSIHIKTALSVPKLDKVNEQIRGDRHPSEVLARSIYFQPTASALVTPKETAYYGMGMAEQKQQQQMQEQQLEQQLLHQQTIQLQPQSQQQQAQQHQQRQHQPLLQMQQLEQQQPGQHQQQCNEQVALQQNIDSAGTNNVASSAYPTNNDSETRESKDSTSNAATKILSSEDDVFDFDFVGYALGLSDTDTNRRPSPTSSVSSGSSSHVPITRSDRPSAETIANDMAIKHHVDYHKLTDSQPVRSDRPSSQTSPVFPRKSSRNQQDGDRHDAASARSSTGSIISSRESLDLDSSFSSQGRQKSSTSSLERSDRPSVSHHQSDHVTSEAAEHAVIAARLSGGGEQGRPSGDQNRYVPKREVMRLDRPSQYS